MQPDMRQQVKGIASHHSLALQAALNVRAVLTSHLILNWQLQFLPAWKVWQVVCMHACVCTCLHVHSLHESMQGFLPMSLHVFICVIV